MMTPSKRTLMLDMDYELGPFDPDESVEDILYSIEQHDPDTPITFADVDAYMQDIADDRN